MKEEDIRPNMVFLSDVIRRGNFPGVTVTGSGLDAKYSIRGVISINFPADPIFDVDGIVITVKPGCQCLLHNLFFGTILGFSVIFVLS